MFTHINRHRQFLWQSRTAVVKYNSYLAKHNFHSSPRCLEPLWVPSVSDMLDIWGAKQILSLWTSSVVSRTRNLCEDISWWTVVSEEFLSNEKILKTSVSLPHHMCAGKLPRLIAIYLKLFASLQLELSSKSKDETNTKVQLFCQSQDSLWKKAKIPPWLHNKSACFAFILGDVPTI